MSLLHPHDYIQQSDCFNCLEYLSITDTAGQEPVTPSSLVSFASLTSEGKQLINAPNQDDEHRESTKLSQVSY